MSRYVPHKAKIARVRRARGIPGYVPSAPVAQHIHSLKTAGWTRTEIARAAHVSPNTIDNIVKSARPCVLLRTATAVLALRAAGLDWLGQPLAEVPAGHRAALAGCQWPDREQVVAR